MAFFEESFIEEERRDYSDALSLFREGKYEILKISQLFPITTLTKILLPSAIILGTIRILVSLCDLPYNIAFTVGGITYAIVFLLFTKLLKLDYISIIKPLIKKQ